MLLDPHRADFSIVDVSHLDFPKSYEKSENAERAMAAVANSKSNYPNLKQLSKMRPYATSTFKQFAELSKRHFRNTIRTPLASVVALIQANYPFFFFFFFA